MTINVIVNGANGRMGQECCLAIENAHSLTLVAKTEHNDDLQASIKQHKAQVVVDFTTPQAVLKNCEAIIESGAYPVIGTTGLSDKAIKMLSTMCEKLKRGAIIAPNFSIGAVLMMKCARDVAKYFDSVEIIELHHEKKIDSPSGTAIKTAELISEAATLSQNNDTSLARGDRHHDIPIHSLRLPGLVAHQAVIFGNQGETFTLKHDAIDRKCFMPGVIMACEKVITLDKLVYGLENLL